MYGLKFKTLKRNKSIIITMPDKGIAVIILNKSDYGEKNLKYLEW